MAYFQPLRANLIILAELYAAERRISLQTIGKMTAVSSGFFIELKTRERRGFNVRTYDALLQWFSNEWNDAAVQWPRDIDRPPRQPKEPKKAETSNGAAA
jgi:hypothetical protein